MLFKFNKYYNAKNFSFKKFNNDFDEVFDLFFNIFNNQ